MAMHPDCVGKMRKNILKQASAQIMNVLQRKRHLDKLKYGMKILIREGSAAKNFEALIDLIE